MDYKNVTQKDFKYLQSIKTRWRDMDAIGHINHAIYLTYFETVRKIITTEEQNSIWTIQTGGSDISHIITEYKNLKKMFYSTGKLEYKRKYKKLKKFLIDIN